MKTSLNRLLAAITLASGLALAAVPAQAASVADKIEALGIPKYIKVDSIKIARRNDFLVIQAEVVNTDNANQALYYRFKWLDDAGFTVGSEEGWKPVTIYGGQKKLIETMAPVPQATDFRLEMHAPDNKGLPKASSSN